MYMEESKNLKTSLESFSDQVEELAIFTKLKKRKWPQRRFNSGTTQQTIRNITFNREFPTLKIRVNLFGGK